MVSGVKEEQIGFNILFQFYFNWLLLIIIYIYIFYYYIVIYIYNIFIPFFLQTMVCKYQMLKNKNYETKC